MRRGQRGAAILAAMLTVTLVATFAATALWQQWRSVEVEGAERSRMQSTWVLTGALDWARLILREDARSGGADHLAEPWAVPLQEARLSTFLAAGSSGATDAGTDTENVFLSGQIIDQQSLLNVNNLVESGRVSPTGLRSFQRLFELLGLPQGQLGTLAENLRLATEISTDNQSATQAPLAPQRIEQLVWLGVSASTVEALRPYVTLLPSRTPVNLNTAAPEVIYAAVNGLAMSEAQELAARRAQSPFRSVSDATQMLPQHASAMTEGGVGVSSRFFEVRGRLRLDRVVVEERSLVQRDGLNVRTLARERGVVDPATLAQGLSRR
ncbi:MAG TPA: type II secretion system minor pseudopilin GspK [Ramlibacter sp.]|jgi:general secretion pathway protein K|uniref:type II secretion system minor pseudopilin GspK n=1 Tax=Ramlibacter sp. TaxID=1917967 RepID=UPI002D55CD89|nr:type II secretion system minor pseudopilin GspK [Ramlibacter sp.]HZY19705.1 type II secretion system minor pseudopilin GspK [Ramlibacter sp.]